MELSHLSKTYLTLGALMASALLVEAVRRVARRHILDVPNERSSHKVPTPRGGGLGIAITVLLGAVACGLLGLLPLSLQGSLPWIALGGVLLTAVSFLDDLRSLPARVRFGVQLIAVAVAIWRLDPSSALGLSRGLSFDLGVVALAVWGLWGVGLCNAYNFMDGIDGIAGLQAVVAGFGWATVGVWQGKPELAVLGMLVAGAAAGFLLHNWHPARIFMGDVGSVLLGYLFAVFPMLLGGADSLLLGVLFVWPFVFDTTATIIRRLFRRENILQAHRSHLYQRLVISGLKHSTVARLYGLLALVGVALGLAVRARYLHPALPLGVLAVLAGALVMFTRQRERTTESAQP